MSHLIFASCYVCDTYFLGHLNSQNYHVVKISCNKVIVKYTMMAKLMKSLELCYTVIKFLIVNTKHCKNFVVNHKYNLFLCTSCCCYVINELVHACSCAYIELWIEVY